MEKMLFHKFYKFLNTYWQDVNSRNHNLITIWYFFESRARFKHKKTNKPEWECRGLNFKWLKTMTWHSNNFVSFPFILFLPWKPHAVTFFYLNVGYNIGWTKKYLYQTIQ